MTVWYTKEDPPRRIIVKGRSLADPDCLVAYIEGDHRPKWIVESSGYVCGVGVKAFKVTP